MGKLFLESRARDPAVVHVFARRIRGRNYLRGFFRISDWEMSPRNPSARPHHSSKKIRTGACPTANSIASAGGNPGRHRRHHLSNARAGHQHDGAAVQIPVL